MGTGSNAEMSTAMPNAVPEPMAIPQFDEVASAEGQYNVHAAVDHMRQANDCTKDPPEASGPLPLSQSDLVEGFAAPAESLQHS